MGGVREGASEEGASGGSERGSKWREREREQVGGVREGASGGSERGSKWGE